MADDLSAFFAKKAQKSKDKKKKAAVNLDEVAQQLERKAKIQEQGEFDEDGNPEVMDGEFQKLGPKLTLEKKQQENEDSEWIEYSDKPILKEINFREFVEQPDEEIEEEKKASNSENVKTWNIVKEPAAEEPVFKPTTKAVYQAPGHARKPANLDLNNEEMFPSIGDADKIEEKLRTEEKKKATTPAKPEEQFETMKPQTKAYVAPRGIPERSSRPTDGPRSTVQNIDSSRPTESSWRSSTTTTTNTTSDRTRTPANTQQTPSKAEEVDNWRSGRPSAAATTTPQSPQRQVNAPAEPQPASNAAAQQTKSKYVPPSMRNKT